MARPAGCRSTGCSLSPLLWFAFDFAGARKRSWLPRPNQLRPSAKTEVAWLAKFDDFWGDYVEGRLARPKDLPQFHIAAYERLPAQDLFRQRVLELEKVMDRSWKQVMRERIIEKRQIPTEMFRDVMKKETLTLFAGELREEYRTGTRTPAPRPSIEDTDMLQSCYGVPGACNRTRSPCLECPQAAGCEALAARVLELVKQRTGHTDPKLARKRELGRERTARCRARKAAPTSTTAPGS